MVSLLVEAVNPIWLRHVRMRRKKSLHRTCSAVDGRAAKDHA
jgi:hypothetical protein